MRHHPDFRIPAPAPWTWIDTALVGIISIVSVGVFLGLLLLFFLVSPAGATWKPEYANTPKAVQLWFKSARTTPAADARLQIAMCCEQAERLRTKFIPSRDGDWAYYPDPLCAHKGCPLKPIPADVVHSDPIKALDPKDDDLPEFKQMRREGVLFIYRDEPSCFWPPEPSI